MTYVTTALILYVDVNIFCHYHNLLSDLHRVNILSSKLIDLHFFCIPSQLYYSPDNIVKRIREALDILHSEVRPSC